MTKPAWLLEAEKHLGYRETPVNHTPFNRHYHLDGQPWCACFVSYCFEVSGHPLPSMQPGMPNGFAAVVYGMDYARAHGCWRPSKDAEPGDIIVYGWAGPGSSPENMHTGFVEHSGPVGSTGHTVEGNRDDRVGRFTFTVGERVVLGTIDAKKLLGIHHKAATKKTAPAKKPAPAVAPQPQPRHPKHPHNTGPTPRWFGSWWPRWLRWWERQARK